MNKCLVIICFFAFGNCLSQNLEEAIYTATEVFIANTNTSTYDILKNQEYRFKSELKTKDEQLAFVFLLCNKAYYLQGRIPTEAILSYENAWSRFTKYDLSKLSDYDIIENCLKPLGNLYTKSGDYTNAENIIKQYIFLAEKNKNKAHQIAGAINLAKLYQTIGKHETVIAIIDKALKTPDITSEQKQKLVTIKSTSSMALSDTNQSIIHTNANVISKLNELSTFNRLKTVYENELKKGDYEKALTIFQKAKKAFFKQYQFSTRDVAKLYFEEAQLYYLVNSQNQALKSLQLATETLLPNFNGSGLPEKEDLYAENTFIDIFDLLALMQLNTEQALQSYNLSDYVSSLLYSNFTSQTSKIESLGNSKIRSEKCIELLFNQFSKTQNYTYLLSALEYAESSKSKVLKEVFDKKSLLEKFPNDSLLVKEQRLLQEQERITNELINEQLGNNRANSINDLSKKLTTVSIDLKQLKKTITKKYSQTQDSTINIEKLQQQLKLDNASLVEYFYGEKAIYQFTITQDARFFDKIELDKSTTNKIVDFNNLFENASVINNNIAEFTEKAFSMYNLLNMHEVSMSKNLIIIPDGLLNFIPFEALLTSETTTTSFSSMPFLIKKQTVLYNSSIAFYLEETPVLQKPNVLGVFPVFDGTDKKLTYSIDEAKNMESEIASTLLMNEKATKNNFINSAPDYNTLHLSTHATGGSFTNPARISFYDKNMPLNELYSLKLNADLVVLSACETGVGKVYKSEGAMSIARGFQYSGVKNLVYSLWQINDLSTSQIMQSFYKNYSKNHSAYVSNHNSKLDYLNNTNISNIKKSPYYWSAFVYYGALTPEKQNTSIIYYLIGIFILIFMVLLLFKKIKSNAR